MKHKGLVIAIGIIVFVNVISVGTLAWLRTRDSQVFSQPCQVHTYGGRITPCNCSTPRSAARRPAAW